MNAQNGNNYFVCLTNSLLLSPAMYGDRYQGKSNNTKYIFIKRTPKSTKMCLKSTKTNSENFKESNGEIAKKYQTQYQKKVPTE